MKKLLFVAIACISLTSCLKVYECECVDPNNSANNGIMELKSNREDEANRFCEDYQTKINNAIDSLSAYECKLN